MIAVHPGTVSIACDACATTREAMNRVVGLIRGWFLPRRHRVPSTQSPPTLPLCGRRHLPYPVYAKWAAEYKQATGIDIVYEAVGSGAGIDMIKRNVVDFGASDAPLSAEELQKSGLMQFPP
jgi:ABC-type phosphate transport system substrate-binding protein